ncbi:MAG TPA: uroporphyrinogen-III C-methyltransferase [Rhizomicrobium sp.]|jgi:uroporphyrin-III C-methyltransferase
MDRNFTDIVSALNLPDFKPGWVWLVGAGPGDPGLITLLGLSAITQADFIVYDALVEERLLALAKPGVGLIFAGKRAGVRTCRQEDISALLADLAREGHRVLRLKGGDPFVFGRGGEEAQELARGGIPFRVVPGITAGIGGLAYAGIPLTHRDTNASVTFLTGHGADGQLPPHDWQAVAKASATLVFYMARKQAGPIAQALMAAGRAANEPVAILANATRADQQTIITDLAGLTDAAAQSPAIAIIVVGRNVLLREELDWLAHAAPALNPS